MKNIPSKLYKKIVELVPIVCVDVILKYKNRYILVKRNKEPLKGEWWLVGGRAMKGELTKEAARRKVIEEIGCYPLKLKIAGIYEDFYPKSAWGVPTSSVSVVYEAMIHTFNYKLDKTSSAIKLSTKLPSRFLKRFIKI